MNTAALTVGGTDRVREIATAFGLTLLVAALCAVLLAVTGVNPLRAYLEIVRGAFGSPNAIAECLVYATPITLTALSVILCFRCGLWNIGADGQLYIGAIAAVGVGFNTMNLPGALVLPAMLVAGFAAGAAYAAIPAFLRLRFGSSEVIVTIMMNFLAATFAIYLIGGPWASGITPATGPIVSSGVLPIIIPGTRLSASFIIAILAAAILSRVLSSSVFGFQVRTIGQNINAAKYAGIRVNRTMFLSFAAGGGLAGLAGFGEIAGIYHNLPAGLSPGFGYTGIVVALLAKLNPVRAVVVAFLLGALNVGADSMQRALGVPVSIVAIMEGLLILLILAARLIDRR
jgi:general nucleoside transport system permease protein